MRIIAEIPHEHCRISIFSMNMKFLIKFEKGHLEQTYKIAEMDVPGGLEQISQITTNEEFMNTVLNRFESMSKDFISVCAVL